MEEELTTFQKVIYNKYLYNIRKAQNKPVKLRKDFKTLSNDKKLILKKLEKFFIRFPNIDIDLFFSAPFALYTDNNHLALEYFIRRKSLKDYQMFKRKMIFDDPDTPYNLRKIVESLKFIKNFIKEKGISIQQYMTIKSNNYLPDFLLHLKDEKISFYVLFEFGDFEKEFSKVEKEIKVLMFSETYLNWPILKNKFYNSKKAKILIREGFKKIESIS